MHDVAQPMRKKEIFAKMGRLTTQIVIADSLSYITSLIF